MKKHLLIFSWEYYGFHSVQGTALAKRPRQVAESFYENGWDVTVIHKDHRNESLEAGYNINYVNGVKRIAVKETKPNTGKKNILFRKIETLYYTAFRGDRSYDWAADVIDHFNAFDITHPALIISFFTPRVPLYLGNYYSKKLKIPWIADLQDPIYEGISKETFFLCRYWMKQILSSAKSIVHISPEWALEDAKSIGKKIYTIRHAIPGNKPENAYNGDLEHIKDNTFYIFYGGSITPSLQSLQLLKQTISAFDPAINNIQVLVAGNASAYNFFKQELGADHVIHLGWLANDIMVRYIQKSNCTLVIPWSKDRIGIPSKFYELCSYQKPIWIIGNDLGAFDTLLNEWQHMEIKIDDLAYQKNALKAALHSEYTYMFNIENCNKSYVTDRNIYEKYKEVI